MKYTIGKYLTNQIQTAAIKGLATCVQGKLIDKKVVEVQDLKQGIKSYVKFDLVKDLKGYKVGGDINLLFQVAEDKATEAEISVTVIKDINTLTVDHVLIGDVKHIMVGEVTESPKTKATPARSQSPAGPAPSR